MCYNVKKIHIIIWKRCEHFQCYQSVLIWTGNIFLKLVPCEQMQGYWWLSLRSGRPEKKCSWKKDLLWKLLEKIAKTKTIRKKSNNSFHFTSITVLCSCKIYKYLCLLFLESNVYFRILRFSVNTFSSLNLKCIDGRVERNNLG